MASSARMPQLRAHRYCIEYLFDVSASACTNRTNSGVITSGAGGADGGGVEFGGPAVCPVQQRFQRCFQGQAEFGEPIAAVLTAGHYAGLGELAQPQSSLMAGRRIAERCITLDCVPC